jgi:hypothetical protein
MLKLVEMIIILVKKYRCYVTFPRRLAQMEQMKGIKSDR